MVSAGVLTNGGRGGGSSRDSGGGIVVSLHTFLLREHSQKEN